MSRLSCTIGLAAVIALPAIAGAQVAPPQPEPQPQPPVEEPVEEPTEPPPDDEPVDDDIAAALAADAATAAETAPPRSGVVQSLQPDLAFIADFAFAWFDHDENLQGGGHDPVENGFALTALELSIGKEVDPYFRFDANLVFGAEGVEIEEAYATTLDLPYSLQARAGALLTRFGRHNPTHPHQWDFVDQPFAMSRVFGGEGNRGPGVELSWLTPLPWFVELVGTATDARGEGTARSFIGDADRAVETPLDLQNTLAAKSFHELSPNTSLLWGASYATGPSGLRGGDRADVVGVDAYLKYRPITRQSYTVIAFTTEWLWRRREVPGDRFVDVNGYAQVFWRFAQRWGTAARFEYGRAATNRAGETGADPLDPDWTEDRMRATAALTYWPSEFSRLRAQVSLDSPGWLPEPIAAGFLSLEVAVGAHGAHAF